MEAIIEYFSKFDSGIFITIALLGAGALLGQWMLYNKCNLPGIAAVVPVWNVIVFLRIMGRPGWQSLFFMLPPPLIIAMILWNPMPMITIIVSSLLLVTWIYFIVVLYIELCNCFGKYKISDYVLCLIFNGLYVLNLAFSPEEEYIGPVYKQHKAPSSPKLAA